MVQHIAKLEATLVFLKSIIDIKNEISEVTILLVWNIILNTYIM